MEKHTEGVKMTISWDTYPHFGVGEGGGEPAASTSVLKTEAGSSSKMLVNA